MFSLCMVESEADEVTLQGVTSVGLKHALDFAYTGQVSMSFHRWAIPFILRTEHDKHIVSFIIGWFPYIGVK